MADTPSPAKPHSHTPCLCAGSQGRIWLAGTTFRAKERITNLWVQSGKRGLRPFQDEHGALSPFSTAGEPTDNRKPGTNATVSGNAVKLEIGNYGLSEYQWNRAKF